MTINEIRKYHQSVPFRPFYLHLANGRRIRVKNPENLGYSSKSATISVFEKQDGGDLIELMDVVKVENANGHGSKRRSRRAQ